MPQLNLCGYIPESINEGPGLRAVLFISGCRHACPGCFQPDAWSFRAGVSLTNELQHRLVQEIGSNPLLDGITLCGGDPFFSATGCSEFVQYFRKELPGLDVWAYTGFTFEELLENEETKGLAALCDVIIDGRFVLAERDAALPYRGSRNQRIVDVAESLNSGCVVEWCSNRG